MERESATVLWKKKTRNGRDCRKTKVIIAVIPKRRLKKIYIYAECKNTTVENSQPPYTLLIITTVFLTGGLYLIFILCVNLFLTRDHFLMLAMEPAAPSVLLGLSPHVDSSSLAE